MFKVIDIKSLLWPVDIQVPKSDGSGDHDEHMIKIEYKTLNRDAIEKLASGGDESFDITDQIVGWADVFDGEGEELKFSKANLKKALKIPYMASGVKRGFWLCQEGYAGKN